MATSAATADRRPVLKSVAIPSEHGGWGLTIEPGLLGLLVEPSLAGLALALAALLLFLFRTPLELVLVDRRRHRRLPRTRVAERLVLLEALVLCALVAVVVLAADDGRWWVPLLVASPLVVVELVYAAKSRRRRLVPELAGAIAIGAVAPAIVIAGDGEPRLGVGLWAIVAARAVTSIPHVRSQIARVHQRYQSPAVTLSADLVALAVCVIAVALEASLIVGACAVAVVIVIQIFRRRLPVAPVKVIGIMQMVFGLAVVVATAVGVAVV